MSTVRVEEVSCTDELQALLTLVTGRKQSANSPAPVYTAGTIETLLTTPAFAATTRVWCVYDVHNPDSTPTVVCVNRARPQGISISAPSPTAWMQAVTAIGLPCATTTVCGADPTMVKAALELELNQEAQRVVLAREPSECTMYTYDLEHAPDSVLAPAGYEVGTLDESDIDTVLGAWTYGTPELRPWVASLIVHRPTVAVRSSSDNNENRLVGWMVRYDDGSCGMLYTDPEHRRKGVAKVIVKAMAHTLAAAGVPVMYVSITVENEASMSLFSSLGFEPADGRLAWIRVQDPSRTLVDALVQEGKLCEDAETRGRAVRAMELAFTMTELETKKQRLAAQARVLSRWPDLLLALCTWVQDPSLSKAEAEEVLSFLTVRLLTSNKKGIAWLVREQWGVLTWAGASVSSLPGGAGLVSKVVSNHPGAHGALLEQGIVASVVSAAVAADGDETLSLWALRIVYSLAFDPSSHPALFTLGAEALIEATLTQVPRTGLFVRAAIAAALLYGRAGEKDVMGLIDTYFEAIVETLIGAGQATLAGNPYPPGSDSFFGLWKICRGIEALGGSSDQAKVALTDAGAVSFLVSALEQAFDDDAVDVSKSRVLESATGALWALAFVPDVRAQFPPLLHTLLARIQGDPQATQGVVRNASALEWLWAGDEADESRMVEEDGFEFDFMVSYSWATQDQALWLRDRLVGAGYRVWVDVEYMTGSTLEAMASAIERSAVIVICFSSAYARSDACRIEAEYCFTLKKAFIPVKAEDGFRPSGWLGALLGSRLYFACTPESWKGMAVECARILGKLRHLAPTLSPGSSPEQKEEVSVQMWLEQAGLSDAVASGLERAGVKDLAAVAELGEWRDRASTCASVFLPFLMEMFGLQLGDALLLSRALGEPLGERPSR